MNQEENNKALATFDFSIALDALKDGKRIARLGWNGKGLYINLQSPTDLSKMTRPYLYITAPAGTGGYEKEELIPWLASQSDLLSSDWIILD